MEEYSSLSYISYLERLQKGAELLVEATAYGYSTSFGDSIERRIEGQQTASTLQEEAYRLLTIGSNEDIINIFNNEVEKYFRKTKNDYLLAQMHIDWNKLEERHRITNLFTTELTQNQKAIQAKAAQVLLKARNKLTKNELIKTAHLTKRPIEPKGLFSSFKKKKYEEELNCWKEQGRKIEARTTYLQHRIAIIDQYTATDKKSKQYRSALKKLIATNHKLALSYNTIKKNEREQIIRMKKNDTASL